MNLKFKKKKIKNLSKTAGNLDKGATPNIAGGRHNTTPDITNLGCTTICPSFLNCPSNPPEYDCYSTLRC